MRNNGVNKCTLTIAALAVMLLATTAISMSSTDNAFAYKKNQATSQADACGNSDFPFNVGCQNTGSQIQGDANSVALIAQQTFPAAESQPPVITCEECFGFLNFQQAISLIEILERDTDEICADLEAGTLTFEQLEEAAIEAGIPQVFIQCIEDFLGMSNDGTT